MKKILFAFAFAASLSACHYGTEEAKNTLDDNAKYKSESADYSVNRANVKAEETAPAATEAPATPIDTAATTK